MEEEELPLRWEPTRWVSRGRNAVLWVAGPLRERERELRATPLPCAGKQGTHPLATHPAELVLVWKTRPKDWVLLCSGN